MTPSNPGPSRLRPACGRFRRSSLFSAAGIAILLPAAWAIAAESPAAPRRIESIGDVEVRTPPCDGLPCRAIYTPARVREWVEALVGDAFDEEKVVRRVERHYTLLGYSPVIEASLVEGALGIRILEAPAVVSDVVVDPNLVTRLLPRGLTEGLPPISRPHALTECLRTRPGDLVNRERLAQETYDLALLGYDLVPVIGADEGAGTKPTSDSRTGSARGPEPTSEPQQDEQSTAGGVEAPPGGPEAAAGGSDSPAQEAGPFPPCRYVILRRIPRRRWREAKEALEGAPARLAVGPLQKRWISGSAEYSRRDLFSARLFYQRAHLLREFDLLEISPYVSQQFAGAIRYQIPYLLPASITPWNVFAEAKIYDEFVPDRLLAGVEADEERRGGRLSLGLEPFRHWNGHSLKGWAYVNRYHVTFSECTVSVNCEGVVAGKPRVPGAALNDVNIVGTAFEYTFSHLFRAPRLSWKFLPSAEAATEAWGGDLTFRRAAGELQQHYWFSTGFEIDARWKAGVVDRRVPVFEQFALGGADSLRGFLRDDFLGRRFVSAQNDVWIPIPFRAFGRDSRVLAALERNLKTALTLDAATVSLRDARQVRLARGIGVGLRYTAETSPLVVRLDAAYGYWKGVSRWYPYLSFSRRW